MMGMFVGLPDGQRDAVTVTLRAYNPLGREVASASVTVGPERSPFVHCLMVVAPDIAYVRFFAESAGEPAVFYFDNLFYVDGEAEEGVCRDTIRITSPANGARLSGRVRVEGELIHSRWPVRVYLTQNGVSVLDWEQDLFDMPPGLTRDPADPTRFTFSVSTFLGTGANTIRASLGPWSCAYETEAGSHSITVFADPTPTPTRTPTRTPTPTPSTRPDVFAVLSGYLTQHGVFDHRMSWTSAGFTFPDYLVAGKNAALRLDVLIGAGFFGATPAVVHPVELHVTYGDGSRQVYRARHQADSYFEEGRPFGGVDTMYFLLPGSSIAPGTAQFELVYYWAGSVVHRQRLGTATFHEMPPMYQYYMFVERIDWDLLGKLWYEVTDAERIFPVTTIVPWIWPEPLRLPRGRPPGSPSGPYDFTWDFVQDDNRTGRLRLRVDLQRVVDCNNDGRIDDNDPVLKVLVDNDGDGRFDFDSVRIPFGGLLGDWGRPEDSNDDGAISENEMANFVRSFYDQDTRQWYDYLLDVRNRWRFSPGDAFVDFLEVGPAGDCQPDSGESTWTPATRRRDNLWGYMRGQARQLMLDDAARSGRPGMVTTALIPSSTLASLDVLGNCGRNMACWASPGFMAVPHEIGHFWGLPHDASLRLFPGGALNTRVWSWISMNDTHNLMFPTVSTLSWPPRANFLSGQYFRQLFEEGRRTRWIWAAEPLAIGVRLASAGPGLAAQAASQRALLVAGTVTSADEVSLDVSYALEAAAVSLPEAQGDYRVELLDANGNILVAVPFAVSFTEECHDCGPGDEILRKDRDSFSLVLPFPQEAVRLRIMHHQAVLLERWVSASPPQLDIAPLPEGLIPRDRPLSLRWEATDPDGDELTFNLAFSRDGGATYKTFAIGLRQPVYELDPSAFPGGQNLYLQVTASDGFHTVTARWGPFSLPDAAPQVAIVHPKEGALVGSRDLLVLDATAIDFEDGVLDGQQVVWEDETGQLMGQGSRLELEGLPPGEHTFTVRATDSAGQKAEARVHITVIERPMPEPPAALPLEATLEGLPAAVRLPPCGASALDLTVRIDPSQPRLDNLLLLWLPPAEAGDASPLVIEPEPAGEGVYTVRFELTPDTPTGTWRLRAIALDAEGQQRLGPVHALQIAPCTSQVGVRWELLFLAVVIVLGVVSVGLLVRTLRGRRPV
jgi:hypothetical protein